MLANWQMNMWEPIINLFGFIPSFGFMIIVFTICLKLVLSPLDFFNKKISRSSALKQAQIQPKLEKLKKQIKDPKILQQKTMELYKREGYNIYGSCLFMILNLAITLFIFITLWSALSQMSEAKILNQYNQIQDSFDTTFNTEMKKTDEFAGKSNDEIIAALSSEISSKFAEAKSELEIDKEDDQLSSQERQKIIMKSTELLVEGKYSAQIKIAQDAASTKYEEIKDNWLWIDNIWRPDTYASGYPNYSEFAGIVHLEKLLNDKNTDEATKAEYREYQMFYDLVTQKIQGNYSSWNGYFILVIMAGGITYLSFIITQLVTSKKRKENEPQQQQKQMGSMKFMKIFMPALMVIFTFSYSAAFALYIVMNSAMSTLLSFASLKILEKIENNKNDKPEVQNKKLNDKVEYSR